MNYYSLPIKTDRLLRGSLLEQEDVRTSINQNINLILRSFALSYRYDASFGCVVHKLQASTPRQRQSDRAWRESLRREIEKNLKEMLQRYETRIKVSDVFVKLVEPKHAARKATIQVKVEVAGQLTLGRKEKYYWPDSEVEEEA
ncbi:MAG: GPW/gp25 family protein, partial [Bacteroidota bacterium]